VRPFSLVLLTRALGYGGAERQLVALAAGLHRRGHRILVLTFYAGGPLERDLVAAGVPVEALGKRHRWDLVSPMLRAVRILRRIRPDLLHGYLVDANVLSTLLRRVIPRAHLVWGVRASALDFAAYPRLAGTLFRVSRRLARRADLIIANSRSGARDHIIAGYPESRVTVIPNGIDTERFRPDSRARERMRRAWGIGGHERVIGLVGRLDPMKGHATFLQAAARFLSMCPGTRFVCVGDGPAVMKARLGAATRECGLADRVLWLLPEPDAAAVYNGLDLLTSASLFGEGFSNVIGEAMACGVRCVVTDVGDSAWVVGETGLVVPPGDPGALAEAWARALSIRDDPSHPDPRSRVQREFNLDRLIRRTEEALSTLLRPAATPDTP